MEINAQSARPWNENRSLGGFTPGGRVSHAISVSNAVLMDYRKTCPL
jgi:hypothetical protein